uniref:SHSP domain-containing protein n=1 Tax=Steinernema glaseri TaxID=37863 RepID=A0A1I7Y9T2_9BILA
MALLLSDSFFPSFGRLRPVRRRHFWDPFDHLLQEISALDAGVTRKDGVFSLSFPTADFVPEELESVFDAKGNLCVSAKIKKPAVEEGKRNIPIGMAERAEPQQK